MIKKICFSLVVLSLFAFTSCNNVELDLSGTTGTVIDVDGNVYKTITIGSQTWMVENLRAVRYRNGDSINLKYAGDTIIALNNPVKDTIKVSYNDLEITAVSKLGNTVQITNTSDTITLKVNTNTLKIKRKKKSVSISSASSWSAVSRGAVCSYKLTANTDSIKNNGLLYNFYAIADSRNVAPQGWHIPTKSDWVILESYLNNHFESQNIVAKSISAKTGWSVSDYSYAIGNDLTANNTTGFTALPSGCRDKYGNFKNMGLNGLWWAKSGSLVPGSTWCVLLLNNYNDIMWTSYENMSGLSIRCVKDNN